MPYPTTDEGKIAYWERQITYARQQMKPYFDASERLIKIYNNLPTTQREKTSETFSPENISRTKANIIFAWIDQSSANLTQRDPLFAVQPLSKLATGGVSVVSSIVNYWYRVTRQLHHDRRCLLDAFLCPYAVKKIGWTADVVSEDDLVTPSDLSNLVFDDPLEEESFILAGVFTRVTDTQDHVFHIEHHTASLQDPMTPADYKPLLEKHIEEHEHFDSLTQPEANTTIQWEAPFGVRWEPDMFLVDPLARDGLNDARWIAYGWVKPLEEVKANENYSHTERLEPSARMERAPEKSPALDHDDFGLVRGWEIWSRNMPVGRGKRVNMLTVFAEGHEKILREDKEWPYTNITDYPGELLTFQTDIKHWINRPLLTLAGADNIQTIVNEILDSYLSVVRKQKNIWLYDPRIVSEELMENILQADEATSWPVEGLADSNGKAIQALPFLGVPSEKGDLLDLIQNLFDRAAGTPQPVRAPTSQTATEASIHERRTTAREQARLDAFQDFQVGTARKFWQLHQQFQPNRQFLIDPRAKLYSDVSPDVARGEYQFRIDIGSQSTVQAVERKQYLDLLNLLSGLVQPAIAMGLPPPNLPRIAELLLVRGYDIQNPEELWPALETDSKEYLKALSQDPITRQLVLQAMSKLRGGSGTPEENGLGGESANPINPRMFSQPAPSEASINADVNRV